MSLLGEHPRHREPDSARCARHDRGAISHPVTSSARRMCVSRRNPITRRLQSQPDGASTPRTAGRDHRRVRPVGVRRRRRRRCRAARARAAGGEPRRLPGRAGQGPRAADGGPEGGRDPRAEHRHVDEAGHRQPLRLRDRRPRQQADRRLAGRRLHRASGRHAAARAVRRAQGVARRRTAYRSAQTASDLANGKTFYVAKPEFGSAGAQIAVGLVRLDGRLVVADSPMALRVGAKNGPPDVGQKAIRVHTLTPPDVGGDLVKLTTRDPPAPELLGTDFADVLGKKPVVLLFATPALCASRTCGPVVDIAEQVRAQNGKGVSSSSRRSTRTTTRARASAPRCPHGACRPSRGRSSSTAPARSPSASRASSRPASSPARSRRSGRAAAQ